MIDSKIRAFNVHKLTRSANYLVQQQLDYVKEELLSEPTNDTEKKLFSKRGYLNALASATHGGVIATGGIRRDAVLHLAALRLLKSTIEEKTLALRRYILGLSLTALTAPTSGYLRQGCNLVPDIEKPREFSLVYCDGRREEVRISHADALAYAKSTASAFGVASAREVDFSKEAAKKDIADATKKKGK